MLYSTILQFTPNKNIGVITASGSTQGTAWDFSFFG
jgi:hypothetical protein